MNLQFLLSFALVATRQIVTLAAIELPKHIFMGTGDGYVKAYSLMTSKVSVVLPGSAVGVAFDSKSKTIYISSGFIIRRANIDGSGVEVVFNSNDYSALMGMSMDSSIGNLYAVTYRGYVLVQHFKIYPQLYSSLLSLLTAIAILHCNPQAGLMYFTTYYPAHIWQAGMNGSNLKAIYNDTSNPTRITVAAEDSKLFWSNLDDGRILSSDLGVGTPKHCIGSASIRRRSYWSRTTGKSGILGSTSPLAPAPTTSKAVTVPARTCALISPAQRSYLTSLSSVLMRSFKVRAVRWMVVPLLKAVQCSKIKAEEI